MPMATKEEQREYARKWYAQRRADWFADKYCAVCGSTEELELDHIDPSTKMTHNIWSYRAEIREAELAKCQVLCRVHHDHKTRTDGSILVGSKNRSSKLTEDDVRYIRQYVADGGKRADMARMFNVDRKNITFIVNRTTWKHVE